MIVVPHTDLLRPATARWAAANGARLCPVDPADPAAYWRLLHRLWTAPGDLTVVEHDVVPAAGVVAAMTGCARPWCVSPYPLQAGWATQALGCTRLAGRLKTRHPDLIGRAGDIADHDVAAKDWRRLDVRLAGLLRGLGYRPHRHRRSTHLHNYGEAHP